MRKSLKRRAVLILAAILETFTVMTASAGEWEAGNAYFGEHYRKDDGSIASNEWIRDGGNWYLTDVLGQKRIGWFENGGNWYYLEAPSGIRVSDTTTEINGVTYTFDAFGAWIPDEASVAAGRVFRSNYHNVEITVPYYFEIDASSEMSPFLRYADEKSYFSVTFHENYRNCTVKECVNMEVSKYERAMMKVEEVTDVTINGRLYTKVIANDEIAGEPYNYCEYFYNAGTKEDPRPAHITFSGQPRQGREQEIAAIIATAKPLR